MAELSRCLTILWVLFIVSVVLGMYGMPSKLSNAFGRDLCDFDLDTPARYISRDTLFIKKHNRGRLSSSLSKAAVLVSSPNHDNKAILPVEL